MPLLQILAVLASLTLLIFVVEAVRRNRLNARYSILWMGASFVLLVLSLYRPLLDWVAKFAGVAYPPSLLFMVAFLFLLCIVLHFSLVLSSHRDSIRRLAQTIALLEQSLHEHRSNREIRSLP
jgi:hypothetical protein